MSEALRLAELIERDYYDETLAPRRGAAELRRLHAERTEIGQALKRAIERNNELEALNAELLEALKHAAECVQTNYLPDKMGHDWDDVIAKAEANNG